MDDKDLVALERFAVIGRMTAGLAHDLRGPLHVLASTAESRLAGPGAEARADWELVQRSALHAARALQAVVDFSKTGAPALKPGGLDAVVQAALALLERPFRDRAVRVETRFSKPPDLPLDSALLQGVFYNILNNALEAMPEGGTLSVKTSREAAGAVVTVKDTGSGLSPEALEHAGRAFFTTKAGGTGLGLYVSRLILEAHGATLSFASTRGKGATARVRFPGKP